MTLIGTDFYDPTWLTDRMCDALAARAMASPAPEAAQQFVHVSFAQLAHASLVRRRIDYGCNPKTDPTRCISLALGTTDFPVLVADVLEKILLASYSAPVTYRRIARESEIRSFRPHSLINLGELPSPEIAGESAEFVRGTVTESGETITLAKFGVILDVSFELLVNDDLDAFRSLAETAGARFAQRENQFFFETAILPNAGMGPNLSDGLPVYDAGHANVAGPGPLDATRLGEARALLKQMLATGGAPLNTEAAFLLVSPAAQTAAEQLIATLHPERERLEVLGDAALAGNHPRFYVLAAPEQSNYAFGYLKGARLPRLSSLPNFETSGISIKVRQDFGAAACSWRGGVSGAGA